MFERFLRNHRRHLSIFGVAACVFVFTLLFVSQSNSVVASSDGTIQARVWDDRDGDGKQDEPHYVEGVTVEVLNTNNTSLTPAVTGVTGANGVTTLSVPPGTYKLQFTLPVDHAFTHQNKTGVPDDKDSDVNRNNGRSQTFSIAADETINTIDAGLWTPGEANTRVWDDRDGDGKQDEPHYITGVTVNVLEANNSPLINPNTASPVTATTDSNGNAMLDYIPADRPVKLQYVLPADHAFTHENKSGVPDDKDSDANRSTGRTHTFQATEGNQNFTIIDAGMWAPGQVNARVWDDRDGDGKQDEPHYVQGITVRLLEENNTPVKDTNGNEVTGTTGANGVATLSYVPADRKVKLQFDLPADHAFTHQNKNGVPDDKDSDANRNTGRTATFQASEGSQNFTTFDAGMWVPGQVDARVWDDRDGDGKQDEPHYIEGVTVHLLESDNDPVVNPNNGQPVTGTTGANGVATLNYVPADRAVKLQFDILTDHAFTHQNKNGVPDDKDSDANRNNGRTATFSATEGSQKFTTVDAGMWAPGQVNARVWDDRDGDGKQDEPHYVSGVTVKLLEANNSPVLDPSGAPVTAVTGADGVAVLSYVPANRQVKLEFDLLTDHAFTHQTQNGVPTDKNSDANRNTGRTPTFQAIKGSQVFNKFDAGMWTPGQVNARVWEDRDADGKQDEPHNVFGMQVNLLEENNSPVIDPNTGKPVVGLTQCNGVATLSYVPADRKVKLEFVPFVGGVFTDQNKTGVPDDKDSDPNRNNGRTATFKADRGNQSFTTWDAGMTTIGTPANPGTIISKVWNDKDGDGRQDGNEGGIEGATVRLFDAAGTLCATTTTASNGIATFSAPALDYRLGFAKADHGVTKKGIGNNIADSDAVQATGITPVFSLAAGETEKDVDGGLWAPGTVNSKVWNDKDGDGRQDGNEGGVAGVEVMLLEEDGVTVLATTITGNNGVATFTNVPSDRKLTLKWVGPADTRFTKRNIGNENADSDANLDGSMDKTFQAVQGSQTHTDHDAGLWLPGTVNTKVWNDKDGDGRQDGNESGVAGVEVHLIDPNGMTILATATTGNNGIATFNNVPADRPLTLKWVDPTDTRFTKRNIGNEDADSDANLDGSMDKTFQAVKGSQTHTDHDAGIWLPGTVNTKVWNDKDGDGRQDGNESGVPNVQVFLLESDGTTVLDTAITGNNGIATFTNVPADRPLTLKWVDPTDTRFTKRNIGNEDADSDANLDGSMDKTFQAVKGSQTHTDHDAGLWLPGTVNTKVWNDKDGDGRQDGNESGVAGVEVHLIDPNGMTILATATTGNNGIATFNNVPADRPLTLKWIAPDDTRFTKRNIGNEDADSDANLDGSMDKTFQAVKGSETHTDHDAGIWLPGTVNAKVWDDKDGDGRQDGNEGGISGVTVELIKEDGTSFTPAKTAVTGNNGVATITGVPADQPLRLKFVKPPTKDFTKLNIGDDSSDSDANRTTGITASFSASKGSQVFTDIDAGLVAIPD